LFNAYMLDSLLRNCVTAE